MPGLDRVRLLIATVLVGSHLLLTAAAFASPPDPLVHGGIFDDADGDDIVLLVMAMTGTVVESPLLDGSVSPVGVLEPGPRLAPRPTVPARARPIRAPPAE
jgi:hypothetical protein